MEDKTRIEDLRKQDLRHYDNLSRQMLHYSSGIPRAINFYYDYHKMTTWEKIKLAFKKDPRNYK